MGAKVKGIREAQANLDRLIGNIRGRKVVRAIQSALLIGGSQAALYTPIDTSTLLNSQYREISVNGSRVTGRVGYSANYSIYVHDPNVPQTFRRATAQKEFLTKGFGDTKAQIDRAVKKEMQL
ncbi:TPA: HK97 gp10 family phage protein [Serratia marcescens]|nr:HK97 gp10 family phage protein [Serratia marcescens]